jgi:predicted negative regulator of RcsB-dependent stress response
MLKPKRKITRQEIQKDPFLEFINEAQQWLKDNKKLIYQVAFGVIAVVAVLYFLNNSRSNSSNEGEALLGKALLSQDMGDVENTKFQLQSLVDDYAGTDAGLEGKYYLGKIAFDNGENETTVEYLNDYVKKGKNSILMTTAFKILYEIAIIDGNGDEAEKLLEKGIKFAKDTVYGQEMSLLLANQLFDNGKKDKAEKIVDSILEKEDIQFSIKRSAEELKGRFDG